MTKITEIVSVRSSHQYISNDTDDTLRNCVKALFDLYRILTNFICLFFFILSYWLIQFPFYLNSTSIYWIKFFLSFQFRRPECSLTPLTFVILFARNIIAVSLRLLCDCSFCAWIKSKFFSFSDIHYNTSVPITTVAVLLIYCFNGSTYLGIIICLQFVPNYIFVSFSCFSFIPAQQNSADFWAHMSNYVYSSPQHLFCGEWL
jgi:hypothetical protein